RGSGRAARPDLGGGQLAAAPGQGQARAGQGGRQGCEGAGPARFRPCGADQAGPDDGADGRAVASPTGGRQDVAAAPPSRGTGGAPGPTPVITRFTACGAGTSAP